jgi:hypothetical protein
MKTALAALALLFAFALGALSAWHFARREKPLPDAPALILKVREVARLETLDVSLYKKVDFSPDPPPSESGWVQFAHWVKEGISASRGRAIVFAVAHLSLDLRKLDVDGLRVSGRRVEVVLPRVQTRIELLPAQTEIIGSNLDSQETAQLFEAAKNAFEGEVSAEKGLQERARASAQQSLRSLFLGLGFAEVDFVDKLSPEPKRG